MDLILRWLESHPLQWVLSLCSWLILLTLPAQDSMIAVGVLVTIDLIVGIWAAKKRGEKITSYGLRRTITTKVFPYEVAVLCAYYVENHFFAAIPIMKAISGFIAIAETKSIFENLGQITGLNFWEAIREKLQPAVKEAPKDPPKSP